MNFDTIWTDHVIPLAGEEIKTFSGEKNEIISVDKNGITRITSQTNDPKPIRIEPFQWAVDRLLTTGTVKMTEIHSAFEIDRCSAGVFAVLMRVPFFQVVPNSPATLTYNKHTV